MDYEMIKLGWDMYAKIFEGFGGWYSVGAFAALVTWLKWYIKA